MPLRLGQSTPYIKQKYTLGAVFCVMLARIPSVTAVQELFLFSHFMTKVKALVT